MKKLFFIISIAFFITTLSQGCKKESFIESADALLTTSTDTLHYDTVFTSVGSITQSFKIFNLNDKKLRLSNIQLMGGSSSYFKINVDGVAGTNFSNVEINANDSIYVFAIVTINPTTANLPFIVNDSIKINYNGNTKFVQLEAFGQNANFLRNKRVTTDTTWNNDLPFVVLGGLTIDSAKMLTITKGTKVYVHADAPIIVRGTLNAVGEKYDSTKIVFKGDRLDSPYKDFPGSWPGIYFMNSSKDNLMEHCIIKNAYQGTVVQNPSNNSNAKLTLNECVLDNIYDVAIGAANTSINVRNTLISNCGYNVFLTAGGNYNFNYCTMVSIGNNYLQHKNAVLTISNVANTTTTINLNANFNNCIVYGESGLPDDEINLIKQGGTTYNVVFNNLLYKMKSADPGIATFNGNKIKNIKPEFDSIDVAKRYFSFKLKNTSPAKDKGFVISGITTDLEGKNRNVGTLPDLGCYEIQ